VLSLISNDDNNNDNDNDNVNNVIIRSSHTGLSSACTN